MVSHLPHVNALLNTTAAALLITGLVFIRRGRWQAHAFSMIGATLASIAFLTSYLIYHYHAGEQSTRQMSWLPHWLRGIYLVILFVHLLAAMVLLPLVVSTLHRAARRRWHAHRALAPWTAGIWLYVSISGVVVYWMLYRLFPSLR